MFCSVCGIAVAPDLKYCNRCGSQLPGGKVMLDVESSESRLREEMVDLFWLTVFGLGIILGGMALIKNVLHLSDWVLVAYMILSSTAFTINFALSLWQIRRLSRIAEAAKGTITPGQLDTNELGPKKAQAALESVPSVTENTTRTLEPLSNKLLQ